MAQVDRLLDVRSIPHRIRRTFAVDAIVSPSTMILAGKVTGELLRQSHFFKKHSSPSNDSPPSRSLESKRKRSANSSPLREIRFSRRDAVFVEASIRCGR